MTELTHVHFIPDANLDLRVGLGKSLASITSIPASWDWTYTSASSGLVADVSFDLWLSDHANTGGASSSSTFEMYVVKFDREYMIAERNPIFSMIWLSARGG